MNPSGCGLFDDDDFTASEKCCACLPQLTPTPSTTPSPAPTTAPTTPTPTAYCLCNRTLVVAIATDNFPDETTWTLTMGNVPDNCIHVDGSASGGPYSDNFILHTEEITICEGVAYTFEILDSYGDGILVPGYYYLALDGIRFKEGGNAPFQSETFVFTSLVQSETTKLLSGSLGFDGIAYETALANEGVFVAAIASMCAVEEVVVFVTISQAARRHRRLDASDSSHQSRLLKAGRRRLDDDGVTVTYDVVVEDGDVVTIINRVEGYTDAQIDVVFFRAAAAAGVADDFETLVTTEFGTFTFTDPNVNDDEFEYTSGPTISLAPSLSPAPSPAPSTAAPTLRPSMLVFIASFVLLVKDMPEQEGGAGDLWRGPGFAAFMVLIGTLTLLMTAYTLIVDSALAQKMFARWSRGRRVDRVKPVESPAPAVVDAPAPCVA